MKIRFRGSGSEFYDSPPPAPIDVSGLCPRGAQRPLAHLHPGAFRSSPPPQKKSRSMYYGEHGVVGFVGEGGDRGRDRQHVTSPYMQHLGHDLRGNGDGHICRCDGPIYRNGSSWHFARPESHLIMGSHERPLSTKS